MNSIIYKIHSSMFSSLSHSPIGSRVLGLLAKHLNFIKLQLIETETVLSLPCNLLLYLLLIFISKNVTLFVVILFLP